MGGGVDRAVATASPPHASAGPGASIINLATGFSTDYLNHFTEAVMALEMVPAMPDCLPDLEAWKPKTYCEHFASSRFSNRDTLIKAYWDADPKARHDLDALSQMLNAALEIARDAMVARFWAPGAADFASQAVAELKPLIARMSAITNGTAIDAEHGHSDAQAAIDALFGP
jgi:hypothetical protein